MGREARPSCAPLAARHRPIRASPPYLCFSRLGPGLRPLPHSNPCPPWHLNPTSSPRHYHSGDSQPASPASLGISPGCPEGILHLLRSTLNHPFPPPQRFHAAIPSSCLFPSLTEVATMYPRPAQFRLHSLFTSIFQKNIHQQGTGQSHSIFSDHRALCRPGPYPFTQRDGREPLHPSPAPTPRFATAPPPLTPPQDSA